MNDNATQFAERVRQIQKRIEAACSRAGRATSEITFIAVTKTHPAETLEHLLAVGLSDFGENRVQEFDGKFKVIGTRARWHFIGHLQRNKVAQVVGRADLIHSVDSARLIEEIEKRAASKGLTQRVLLEINVGRDPDKTSAAPEDLPAMLEALSRSPHVRAEGLMTVPPYDDNPENSRPYFRQLRDLMKSIAEHPHFHAVHLSMGMSGDFEVAIEEGATMIRVGSALLGERAPEP